MIDREQELEATNQLLETVLEHTHVLVAVLDPQFNFIRVNRAYASADRQAPDFFPGKNHFDLYPNAENRQIFERVIETREPYFAYARPFEYAEHPERGVSYWDWSLVPVVNQHGPVRGLVLTLADVTDRVLAQDALREQTDKLNERVKELNCLFEISRLVEHTGISLPEILQGTVELLPPAWQYPEVACARILLEGQEFRTANYQEGAPWHQEATLSVRGQPRGHVEVSYLESRPESDEGPFVQEERNLLDAISQRLSRVIERHRAEAELRDSLRREQFLGDIIRNASVAIGVGYPDGRLGMSNPAVGELVGYSVEELETLNWRTDLTPPEWWEHEATQLRELYRTKRAVRFEKEYIHKDGSRIPVELVVHPQLDGEGNVEGYVAFVTDITERRQAEEALQRERDLVARIMDTSPVGIVVLDRQGRIVFANAQVEQLTGLARDQILQLDYNDPTWRMVGDNGRTLADDLLPFPQVLLTGQPVYNLQQAVDLPGQPRLLLSMNAAPLYDAAGRTDGVVITIEDVTERERLQAQIQRHAAELEQRVAERTAELQASQAALLQAERLAIAGRLAASLTHEISNPLQSVIGCLGLAEETLAEGGDVSQYLDIALPELRRIARIVARLRNLGRPLPFRASREPTDVHALLEQVLVLSRKQCQDRGIEVELEVADDLPLALLVRDQMQQVFLNLLLNALDATTAGSMIEIRALQTCQPDGVSVQFADDGTGISPNVLPHIFDPFYSTKPDGLGLGLFVSQDIVRQHGGHIEVESQLGAGTRFTVWLPL